MNDSIPTREEIRVDRMMNEHEAFAGVTVDHLYQNCPGLQRAIGHGWRYVGTPRMGDRLLAGVDPLGTDVCGWCVKKWKGSMVEGENITIALDHNEDRHLGADE